MSLDTGNKYCYGIEIAAGDVASCYSGFDESSTATAEWVKNPIALVGIAVDQLFHNGRMKLRWILKYVVCQTTEGSLVILKSSVGYKYIWCDSLWFDGSMWGDDNVHVY